MICTNEISQVQRLKINSIKLSSRKLCKLRISDALDELNILILWTRILPRPILLGLRNLRRASNSMLKLEVVKNKLLKSQAGRRNEMEFWFIYSLFGIFLH